MYELSRIKAREAHHHLWIFYFYFFPKSSSFLMGKIFIIAPTDDPNVAAAKAFSRPNQSSVWFYVFMIVWFYSSTILWFCDSLLILDIPLVCCGLLIWFCICLLSLSGNSWALDSNCSPLEPGNLNWFFWMLWFIQISFWCLVCIIAKIKIKWLP